MIRLLFQSVHFQNIFVIFSFRFKKNGYNRFVLFVCQKEENSINFYIQKLIMNKKFYTSIDS